MLTNDSLPSYSPFVHEFKYTALAWPGFHPSLLSRCFVLASRKLQATATSSRPQGTTLLDQACNGLTASLNTFAHAQPRIRGSGHSQSHITRGWY